MMLHLRPSGKEEQVQASIALYFATDDAGAHPGHDAPDAAGSRLSPPASRQQRVTDSFAVPTDVDLLTGAAARALSGAAMRGFARLPDGRTLPLIHITHWDFDWQDVYRFVSPLFLPAGSTIAMDYTYDNSAANLRNPQHAAAPRDLRAADLRRDGGVVVSGRAARSARAGNAEPARLRQNAAGTRSTAGG